MTNLDSILKSKDITLPTKVRIDKVMVFPVVMYWCERWTIKKAEHFRIDAFELWCWRRFLSPLDSKEVKPVSPKRHQHWLFIERTDAEALKYWPSDVKSWVIGKDSDPAKAWGQEEKGLTEDEMTGWHHQVNAYKSEQTLGDSEGQGSLAQSMGSEKIGQKLATE